MTKLSAPINRILGVLLIALCSAPASWGGQHVLIETEKGNIELELDGVHAPATTQNFLRYVAGGFYVGGSFYRTVPMGNQPDNKVKIEVIQGG